MIFAQPAELRCDEKDCTERLQGHMVANFSGGFVFASSGLKDWQVCPNSPEPGALMLTFCQTHKKQLTSLVQVGPAGPRINPKALQGMKSQH